MSSQDIEPVGVASALPLHLGCPAWEDMLAPWRGMPFPGLAVKAGSLLGGKLTECKTCKAKIGANDTVLLVAIAAKKASSIIEVVENNSTPPRIIK